jgi:peptidyl-prolyl cis-trans isomerase SurA
VISVPGNASQADIAVAREKAEGLLKQASAEKDFLGFSKRVAVTGSGIRSEDLGYRTLDRLPQLLVDAANNISANQMVPRLLQSGAGFHIVKVMDRKGAAVASSVDITITQTQARHILLKHRSGVTDQEAQRRLNSFKEQIKTKVSDFSQIAKKYSEDGSAPGGGALGWMSPGELVPEFEQAMNRLNINEVSEPVRTEFGWHLIQVIERRNTKLSSDKQRDYARAALRERKLDQAYEDWIRQIRDGATVEIRSIDQ